MNIRLAIGVVWWSCAFAIGTLLSLLPAPASAHVLSYGAFDTTLTAEGDTLQSQTTVPLHEAFDFYGPQNELKYFEMVFQNQLRVEQGGLLCQFSLTTFDNTSKPDHTFFKGAYTCPNPIGSIDSLTIHNELFSGEFVNFDHFVTVSIGQQEWSLAFNKTHKEYPAEVPAKPVGVFSLRFLAVAAEFIGLGLIHIVTGYDHILFLLSVVLLARSVKKILILVTAFTVAHSITLLLASFHIVEIAPRIVEPAIALTIAYMALRNIMQLRAEEDGGAVRERWAATFAFGLIHGLAFASALAATSIPPMFFVPSLITFNIGIEIGQISILALVLPALWYVDTLPLRRKVLTFLSGAILALALLWFASRVSLGESCASSVHFAFLKLLCI